jgi:Ca-activated chloride channel family protein
MRKFVSIAIVVVLLLAAAFYFGNQKKVEAPQEPIVKQDPHINQPIPDVKPPQPVSQDQPIVTASADGTLKLTTSISHGYLLGDNPADLYAAVDIRGVKFEGAKRPPLNVSVVIDRSGSMSGDKIVQVKEAARQMVDLLDSQDRISIVTYGSDVTVEFPSQYVTPANRASLIQVINSIQVSGGTNLSGGYERGLAEVKRWRTDETINRVLLMSDGHANIGVTYVPDLERMTREPLAQGISTSTIGFGLDYNEDVMAKMANEGGGNYYFVDSREATAQVFEKELRGLSQTVARNASIILELPPNIALAELYGFPFKQVDHKIIIPLSSFHSEQEKNILLKLAPSPGLSGAIPALTAQLSYDDVTKDGQTQHKRVALRAIAVNDASKADDMVNAEVIGRVQQIEVANSMKAAMDLYNKGEAEKASQLLRSQRQRMDDVQRRHQFAAPKAAAFKRVGSELDDMDKKIQAAPPRSAEGQRMVKENKARSNSIMFDSYAF